MVGQAALPPLAVERHEGGLAREGRVLRVRLGPQVEEVHVAVLESVQQSHFGSRFVLWYFNLQIEMQIGAQMGTVIDHLKPFRTPQN